VVRAEEVGEAACRTALRHPWRRLLAQRCRTAQERMVTRRRTAQRRLSAARGGRRGGGVHERQHDDGLDGVQHERQPDEDARHGEQRHHDGGRPDAEKTDDSTETTARRVAAARLTATDWGGDGARRAEARSEGLQQCSRTAELNVRQEKALMMTMP
jgi:hypothetical protein